MNVHSFEPLTPTAHLDRAADVHRDRLAVIDGDWRCTYAELKTRCELAAGALSAAGVKPGATVAVLAPNTRMMLEAHQAVPWAGGVLSASTREARGQNSPTSCSTRKLGCCCATGRSLPSPSGRSPHCRRQSTLSTTTCTKSASPRRLRSAGPSPARPSSLRLNYTSGTTGSPKGVMYHHRGAYLRSMATPRFSVVRVGAA